MFATVCFGMGLDCPDVREVIHLGSPDDMRQETGRGGGKGWKTLFGIPLSVRHWDHLCIVVYQKLTLHVARMHLIMFNWRQSACVVIFVPQLFLWIMW